MYECAFGREGRLDAKIFCIEVSDDAVALEGIGCKTFEEEFAAVDGYVFVPKGRSTPVRFNRHVRIAFCNAAGHRDIRRFVFGDGDGFAVEDAGRGCLGGGLAVSLHESRIASKGDRCAGVTFSDVDLEEAEGGTAILEVEREAYPLPLREGMGDSYVWRTKSIPDLLEGIVEDEDVVGHIRRDPHKRISMDSLQ